MITRMSQSYRKTCRVKTVLTKKTFYCPALLMPLVAAVFFASVMVPGLASGADRGAAFHTLSEAKNKLKQKVTVRFRVRSTGASYRSKYDELYSEHQWENPNTFFVRIPKSVKNGLVATGVNDIARHFYGRLIDATGVVEVVEFGDIQRYTLTVQQAQDIQLVAEDDATPSDVYARRLINGFTVLLHPQVVDQEPLLSSVITTLEAQLGDIVRLLPANQVERLQKTSIWVEAASEPDKVAVFHRSPDWIVVAAGNLDKLGHIEIVNAQNYVDLSRSQPSILLHQFAHAFHEKVLGSDNRAVADWYQQVQLRHLYDRVEHVTGKVGVAYATLDEFEYFAELTEAFFGRNDYFPYTREHLKAHDPVGHDLISDLWLRDTTNGLVGSDPVRNDASIDDSSEKTGSLDAEGTKVVTGD